MSVNVGGKEVKRGESKVSGEEKKEDQKVSLNLIYLKV